MNDDGKIDRTSAVGLFNYARSYWQSGVYLDAAKIPNITHPSAPVTFVLCHSIELYLKAYLRGIGRDLSFLKKLGHRVADLAKAAAADGLTISAQNLETLSHIEDADVAMEARYIVTGFKEAQPNAALTDIAADLDKDVCAALTKQGHQVRAFDSSTKVLPPPPTGEIEGDTLRVMKYLFENKHEDRGTLTMQFVFDMQEGMLQYHLDCLRDAEYADSNTGNYVTGEWFWHLTSEGRRYLVARKLV